MLLLQAHCGSEHASLNAHIFAEDHYPLVAGHFVV
jgi:hypothetical protein